MSSKRRVLYKCRTCGEIVWHKFPSAPRHCEFCGSYLSLQDIVDEDVVEDVAEKATTVADNATPLDEQVGGSHYKDCAIQPAEFVHANKVPYLEGSIIYYVFRWRNKNGIEDLKKARHTIDLLIQLEESKGGGK